MIQRRNMIDWKVLVIIPQNFIKLFSYQTLTLETPFGTSMACKPCQFLTGPRDDFQRESHIWLIIKNWLYFLESNSISTALSFVFRIFGTKISRNLLGVKISRQVSWSLRPMQFTFFTGSSFGRWWPFFILPQSLTHAVSEFTLLVHGNFEVRFMTQSFYGKS